MQTLRRLTFNPCAPHVTQLNGRKKESGTSLRGRARGWQGMAYHRHIAICNSNNDNLFSIKMNYFLYNLERLCIRISLFKLSQKFKNIQQNQPLRVGGFQNSRFFAFVIDWSPICMNSLN